MADLRRAAVHRPICDDPLIVVAGRCSANWAQCADVIVAVHEFLPTAVRWAVTTLIDHPGCTAAVALHRTGLWRVSVYRRDTDRRCSAS